MSRCLSTDGGNNYFTVTPLFNFLEILPSLTSNSVIAQALLSNLWPVESMEEEDHVTPPWVSVSYRLLNVLFYSPVVIPPPLLPPVFLLTHTYVHTLPNPLTPKPYLPYLLSKSFYTSILHFLECSWHSWSFYKRVKMVSGWVKVDSVLSKCISSPIDRHRYSSLSDSSL